MGSGGCRFCNQSSSHAIYKTKQQFCRLVCGVLAPGKLLLSPKEAVTPLLEHLCLVGSVLQCNVTMTLKEVVADPTWVRSAIATRHSMC